MIGQDFGVSFSPTDQNRPLTPQGAPLTPVQQAIKILSLRVPSQPGASALAPSPLLTGTGGRGAMGGPGGIGGGPLTLGGAVPPGSLLPYPGGVGGFGLGSAGGFGYGGEDFLALLRQLLMGGAHPGLAMPGTPPGGSIQQPMPGAHPGLAMPGTPPGGSIQQPMPGMGGQAPWPPPTGAGPIPPQPATLVPAPMTPFPHITPGAVGAPWAPGPSAMPAPVPGIMPPTLRDPGSVKVKFTRLAMPGTPPGGSIQQPMPGMGGQAPWPPPTVPGGAIRRSR